MVTTPSAVRTRRKKAEMAEEAAWRARNGQVRGRKMTEEDRAAYAAARERRRYPQPTDPPAA